MTRACAEAPATYFRLSDETWSLIVEEYADGKTAKQLGAKWKVAPNSIYRHVSQAGLTKRDCGDRRARAHARSVELATRAKEAKAGPAGDVPDPALLSLFAEPLIDDPDAADPAALARQATLASGRAMRGRLWAEAKALAGLAESYARLAERERGPRGRFEPMDPPPDAEEMARRREALLARINVLAAEIEAEEAAGSPHPAALRPALP